MVCTLWNWTIVREAADLQWQAHQTWRRVWNMWFSKTEMVRLVNCDTTSVAQNVCQDDSWVRIPQGMCLLGTTCTFSFLQQYAISGHENNVLFHHRTLAMKCASKEWEHPGCPWLKKFQVLNSAGIVMGTMFWAHKGVLLVDLMQRGTTINADGYCMTLRGFRTAVKWKYPGLLTKCVFA